MRQIIIAALLCASCCGTIKQEEFSAMAERECPNLLKAAENTTVELTASQQHLIDWCKAEMAK